MKEDSAVLQIQKRGCGRKNEKNDVSSSVLIADALLEMLPIFRNQPVLRCLPVGPAITSPITHQLWVHQAHSFVQQVSCPFW